MDDLEQLISEVSNKTVKNIGIGEWSDGLAIYFTDGSVLEIFASANNNTREGELHCKWTKEPDEQYEV